MENVHENVKKVLVVVCVVLLKILGGGCPGPTSAAMYTGLEDFSENLVTQSQKRSLEPPFEMF